MSVCELRRVFGDEVIQKTNEDGDGRILFIGDVSA